MRNDKHGAEIIGKKILQPHDRVDVKTVCRLVKHDDIGIPKKRLRQHDLHLFAFLEVAHHQVKPVVAHAKSLNQTRRLGVSLPTVQFGKFGFQLGRANAVFLGKILFFVDGVLFYLDLIQTLVAHQHRIQYGVFVEGKVILTQNRHANRVGNRYLARRRLQFTAQDLEKGGLSRTVCTDDAIAVSGGKFQVNVLKEKLTAKVKAKIGNCDHDIPPFLNYLYYSITKSCFLQYRLYFFQDFLFFSCAPLDETRFFVYNVMY